MNGSGLFSSRDPAMAAFLANLGKGTGTLGEEFIARNFLLDEGVIPERYDSYRESGGVKSHRDYDAWNAAHQVYLEERVFRPGAGLGPPGTVDLSDPDVCPETFQHIEPSSPFLRTAPGLDLIRVEQIGFIAERSGEPAERVMELAREVVRSNRDGNTDAYRELGDILDQWAANIDCRPVFAGFWQEVYDLFGNVPELDKEGWADSLRDRFGLFHLNPTPRARMPVDVVVFRYPVSKVPALRREGIGPDARSLVPPTVLDGRHSVAFCPAPRGELTGYTVDLGGDNMALRQEVLHPVLAFRPSQVWRVGTIRRSVAEAELRKAREWHLEVVRDRTGRRDYAAETDG